MSISVRCQLTVEISGSNYGDDWSLKDIIKQTKEEAPNRLSNMIRNQEKGIRIIGNPVVTVIVGVDE